MNHKHDAPYLFLADLIEETHKTEVFESEERALVKLQQTNKSDLRIAIRDVGKLLLGDRNATKSTWRMGANRVVKVVHRRRLLNRPIRAI